MRSAAAHGAGAGGQKARSAGITERQAARLSVEVAQDLSAEDRGDDAPERRPEVVKDDRLLSHEHVPRDEAAVVEGKVGALLERALQREGECGPASAQHVTHLDRTCRDAVQGVLNAYIVGPEDRAATTSCRSTAQVLGMLQHLLTSSGKKRSRRSGYVLRRYLAMASLSAMMLPSWRRTGNYTDAMQ